MAVNPSALGQNKGLSELWRRLRFVFMAIIIYRIGTHIPIPGIDTEVLSAAFQNYQNTLLGLYNLFAGGAFEKATIFALVIIPRVPSLPIKRWRKS